MPHTDLLPAHSESSSAIFEGRRQRSTDEPCMPQVPPTARRHAPLGAGLDQRQSKGSLGHAFTMCCPSQTPHLTMSSARIGPRSEPWVKKKGQELIYERRPSYCNECKQIRHYTDGCEKHKAEVKRRMQGKGVIHTPNGTAKGVHTYLSKEGQEHGRDIGTTTTEDERNAKTGGQPSRIQTGAGKGQTVVRKQNGRNTGKAQAADTTSGGENIPKRVCNPMASLPGYKPGLAKVGLWVT
ncbi:hypothetical protein RND71_023355 [Anisodus tanguticus]|uniref:Uncharacterized protein n=1 Tax=Anisodus tanguticus TaxID=243964 RepID=A0AAE1VEP1_9SOLA|nr:hypothetical protein RND71_023355 [Anisodus tanguticus]